MAAPAFKEIQQASPALPIADAAWHQLSTDSVAQHLDVDPQQGLTPQDADQRAAVCGRNEIQEQQQRAPWRMFFPDTRKRRGAS